MENNIIELTKKNDIEGVKKAIAEGADLNFQDVYGYTALMLASLNNRPEMVKLLIERGARIDIKNGNDDTALDLANTEITEIIELLTEAKEIKEEFENIQKEIEYKKLIFQKIKFEISYLNKRKKLVEKKLNKNKFASNILINTTEPKICFYLF